ncbi:MAG TPA: FKBP-type peptidyl-prolyl cis-trans isomerase [bacterium]|nr:FKBP-type peptidyl-prolyl cis-trans isomerase [bacterium]
MSTVWLPDEAAKAETTESGLAWYDVKVGEGEQALAGREVVVHYTGWLLDGTQFDSSRASEPFSFVPGQGRVIGGWDEGVPGMRVGGIRKLHIPADLAYGEDGAGDVIPPGATLVFEVELLEVK